MEEEQALVGDLGALDVPTPEVRFPAPRGRRPAEIVALLERIRAEDPEEPFWRGIERLDADDTRLKLDFHLPRVPQLQPVDQVDVSCHLYGDTPAAT